MGEVEAEVKAGKGTRSDLWYGNHTVSLLTDHLVFSPKYRGKVLLSEIAEAAEEIIRENCKELSGIEVFHKKEATLIAENVCGLLQSVGGWWEEWVDLTLCSGQRHRRAVYGKSVRAVR